MRKQVVRREYTEKPHDNSVALKRENVSVSVQSKLKEDVKQPFIREDVMWNTIPSPMVIGGFPVPHHNFPTPMSPQDRDYDYHPFVDDLNSMIRKLNGLRVNLYDAGPKSNPELTTLSTMKLLIQNESLPQLSQQLRSLALMPSDNPYETLYPSCRDTLVNIGVGLFTCGLFLIMMGSNSDDGAEATAANYHLEKGVYQMNAATCRLCGHTNCDPAKGCDIDGLERTTKGSRWL